MATSQPVHEFYQHHLFLDSYIIQPPFLVLLLSFADDLPFKTCGRTWRKVGCFNDLKGGQRALPEQLVNIRDKKSKVYPKEYAHLNWKQLTESFHRYALNAPVSLSSVVTK